MDKTKQLRRMVARLRTKVDALMPEDQDPRLVALSGVLDLLEASVLADDVPAMASHLEPYARRLIGVVLDCR